jgi:hypothetical protein
MTSATRGRPRCILVTVMWGEWHVGAFLEGNLPTLLAAGNLPALVSQADCEYLVYTAPEDAIRLTRDQAFKRLRATLQVHLKFFRPSRTHNPITLHHEVWRAAMDHARRSRAFVVLMPPDVAWANGSLAQLGVALSAGKKATFMTYPRVVSETFVAAMLERWPPAEDRTVTVAPDDMTSLAMTHIHPLMAAYARSSAHFPSHPEMVIWPIEGEGFLLRLLARELFCFEPGRYDLNVQSLLARRPPADEVHVFDDSRKFLGVSFTPLWKDMEWYLRPNRLDPLTVGRWWIAYDSPINDTISAVNLRFGCGRAGEGQWRRVERQADALVTHLRFTREFTRVLMVLHEMGHFRAAAFLAAAMRVNGLARRWPHRGPFAILAPRDEDIERARMTRVPGDGLTATQARAIIEAHVATIAHPDDVKDGIEVSTMRGRRVRLDETDLAVRTDNNVVLTVRQYLG